MPAIDVFVKMVLYGLRELRVDARAKRPRLLYHRPALPAGRVQPLARETEPIAVERKEICASGFLEV